ncbi:MAG: hypothetical protein WC528_03360 [Patescibacteria group bacterium]
MENEKSIYPPAVLSIVESLQTVDEVQNAIEQTQADPETAKIENDNIHLNRIPDLEEMLEALKNRKEKLEK